MLALNRSLTALVAVPAPTAGSRNHYAVAGPAVLSVQRPTHPKDLVSLALSRSDRLPGSTASRRASRMERITVEMLPSVVRYSVGQCSREQWRDLRVRDVRDSGRSPPAAREGIL